MKILESYKKMAKSMLIEHAWDRKFGEPLPTLEDVMREAEVDDDTEIKFKVTDKDGKPTGETDSMPASSAKKMKKTHPAKIEYDRLTKKGGEEEPKSKGLEPDDFERDFDDDEPKGGEPESGEEPSGEPKTFDDIKNHHSKAVSAQGKVNDMIDKHNADHQMQDDDYEKWEDKREELKAIENELQALTVDDPNDSSYDGYKKGQKELTKQYISTLNKLSPDAKKILNKEEDKKKYTKQDDEEPSGEPEGGEKSRMSSTDMDDVDDSLRSLKQQPKDDIKPPPELERGIANVIAKIESGTTTDDDLEWAKDAHKQLNIQSGYNQYLSDMESDLKDALKKADEPEGTDNSAALKKIKRKDLNKLSGGDAWEKDFYSDDDIFLGSPDYEQEEGDAYWESPDLDGLSRATDHTTLKQKFFDLHAYRSTLQSRIEMADDEGDTEEVAKLQKDWMKAAKQQNNIVGMMKPQKPQFKGMSGRSSYGGVGIRDSVTINGKKYKEVKEEKKVTEKHILREMYEKIGGK